MTAVLAGVVGWPVSHSLSPAMHAYWLEEHAIEGSYVALAVQRHAFSKAIAGLRTAGFVGLNITLPHKQSAFALAHTVDPAARMAQTANLLLFRAGEYQAHNTDVEGLVQSLQDYVPAFARFGCAILGAGGAARAAVLSAGRLGVNNICVLNRTHTRAESLVHALSPMVGVPLKGVPLGSWQTLAPQIGLLINATSAGLNGTASPEISLSALPANAVVCDLVYKPLVTPLLAAARARGLVTVDGLGMLMHQGAAAFELLFGARPAVSDALRGRLEQMLGHDS